jgi:hypothetical protein
MRLTSTMLVGLVTLAGATAVLATPSAAQAGWGVSIVILPQSYCVPSETYYCASPVYYYAPAPVYYYVPEPAYRYYSPRPYYHRDSAPRFERRGEFRRHRDRD